MMKKLLFLCLVTVTVFFCVVCYSQEYESETPPATQEKSDLKKDNYKDLYSPLGDYSKLRYIIRSNKKEYEPGEPVYIRFFLRNDSDSDAVRVYCGVVKPCVYHWSLKNEKNQDVPKTLRGKEVFPEEIEEGDEGLKLILNRTQGTHIQPKQEISTFPDELMLSQYFDLSLPGTYKLTCYRTTFLKGFQWEPPFQSNTIEFTIKKSNLSSSPMAKPVTDPITDQTSASLSTEQDPRLALFPVLEEYYNRFKHNYGYTNFYSDQLRYPGDFDNPPHGKEVFEQKEIPERVRY